MLLRRKLANPIKIPTGLSHKDTRFTHLSTPIMDIGSRQFEQEK